MFSNMRFEPAGMTDDPDIRIATSASSTTSSAGSRWSTCPTTSVRRWAFSRSASACSPRCPVSRSRPPETNPGKELPLADRAPSAALEAPSGPTRAPPTSTPPVARASSDVLCPTAATSCSAPAAATPARAAAAPAAARTPEQERERTGASRPRSTRGQLTLVRRGVQRSGDRGGCGADVAAAELDRAQIDQRRDLVERARGLRSGRRAGRSRRTSRSNSRRRGCCSRRIMAWSNSRRPPCEPPDRSASRGPRRRRGGCRPRDRREASGWLVGDAELVQLPARCCIAPIADSAIASASRARFASGSSRLVGRTRPRWRRARSVARDFRWCAGLRGRSSVRRPGAASRGQRRGPVRSCAPGGLR